jgi:hypothetical protein
MAISCHRSWLSSARGAPPPGIAGGDEPKHVELAGGETQIGLLPRLGWRGPFGELGRVAGQCRLDKCDPGSAGQRGDRRTE